MTAHKTGTRQEWLAARLALLAAEKALTRRGDELARRQQLPWVRIGQQYRFGTGAGTASLPDLFAGRSQLLIYHFMFGPGYTAGCPSCSARSRTASTAPSSTWPITTSRSARCRGPLAEPQAYQRRMGWSFRWASSSGSDFSYDFHTAHTKQEWESGAVECNFRPADLRLPPAGQDSSGLDEFASSVVGTDRATYRREGPGVSAFALEDGVVYHTYPAYERGIDGLWGMYPWPGRAPLGRNETGLWCRRHDEYDSQ